MAENILSKKSKPKFSHDGYIYVFDKCSKTNPSLKFWRCELKNECKDRIHTKNQEVVKLVNEHSHGASSVSVEVAKIKTSIKRKAEETLEMPSSVINVCIANSSQAALAALPTSDAMKKIVLRKRNQLYSVPPSPHSARELVIPNEYKIYVTSDGQPEEFLIADSGQENDRILIFGRKSWINILRDSDVWFADGTFKMAPPLFYQVYVIMARKYDGVFPILYALLPNKRLNNIC